jgi:tetratricopeptide (TPR) repeat protein
MTESHIPIDQLLRIADGLSDASAEEHLARCAPCRDDLSTVRRFEASWSSADETAPHESNDGGSETIIRTFEQRIRHEDEEARELLETLLAEQTGEYALGIGRRGVRYRTGGVVRLLCAASQQSLALNVLRATILADEPVDIAQALPEDLYPHSHVEILRGNAWKARANALRFEGSSFRSALDALDHAERAYRRLPSPEYYLATCDYVRATVYARMDQSDKARAFARQSGEAFLSFRDHERYGHARAVEGAALFDSGQFSEARDVFAELVTAAEASGDRSSQPRALLALVELQG